MPNRGIKIENSKDDIIQKRQSIKSENKQTISTRHPDPSTHVILIRRQPEKNLKVVQGKLREGSKISGLTVQSFANDGKSTGTVSLPKEVFGQDPKEKLIAQAVRVYLANSIKSTANTKTRGEVRGGGKKPWRQKGTGRARAGSSRSPLWVGGGTTFGPRYKDTRLSLPQKMKKKALIYALSKKSKDGQIKILSNIEKVEPKTKIVAGLLNKLGAKGATLIVISSNPPTGGQNLKLAARNIPNVTIDTVNNLNAYEIIKSRNIFFSKESLAKFK